MLILLSLIITALLFFGFDFLLDKDPSTFLFIDNFKTNLMFYILFLGVFYMVYLFIKSQREQYQSDRQIKILEAVDKILDSRKNLMWSQFLSIDYFFYQDKVKGLISKGITNNLFHGELKDNTYSRPYLDFISEKTLAKLNTISEDKNINDFKYVAKRNAIGNKLDTYIYTSDKEKITLLLAPFNFLKAKNEQVYAVYDSSKDEDVINIYKSEIVDVFYEDLTYNKYTIAELWLSNDNKTIDDIKVISLTLKDGTVYEVVGSDISLEI